MGMMARTVGAPKPASSASFISPELWELVAAEVLAQCDALDGVRDGIITEPDECDFRPEALLCPSGSSTKCLTPPQVAALRKIYAPLYDGGELLYPRLDPGSERIYTGRATFSGEFPQLTQVPASLLNFASPDIFMCRTGSNTLSSTSRSTTLANMGRRRGG